MTDAGSPAPAAPGRQGLSLKRQLLLWLLLPQLVLLLVGGALAYRVALSYAEKAIDQSLTQSVKSLSRQVKPIGSGLLIDFPRAAQDIIEQDPQDRVSYMVSSPPGSFLLGNAKLPGPASVADVGGGEVLLYTIAIDGKPMRLALLELDYGGIFHIENVPDEQMHPYLMIQCPTMLFPFVRRIVSDVTRDGGFPPLNLDTIDFVGLYRQELARRMEAQKTPEQKLQS